MISLVELFAMGSPLKSSSLTLSVFILLHGCLFFLFLHQVEAFTGTYGVNYGRVADNIPSPESVVTLLKRSKIKNVRIFDADHAVLNAFRGSGLNIAVMVPNELLVDMNSSEEKAMDWIEQNVKPFLPQTHITGIAVGNEIIGSSNLDYQKALPGAVNNIYKGLKKLKLEKSIEVSTPHSQAVFTNSYPPSVCSFKESTVEYMRPLLELFSKTGAPFYINVYPFIAYKTEPDKIDIRYALLQQNPGFRDPKTKLHYDNMFDAQIDAAYAALEDAGYGNIEVRVSETGWASRGGEGEEGATLTNARTYNYNLRKRLAKMKGTPFRPKIVVKAYVFAIFNEDSKPGPVSERNFGLFKADGSIVYDVGFNPLSSSSPIAKGLKAVEDLCVVVTMILIFAT